jgi:hypothetical protein
MKRFKPNQIVFRLSDNPGDLDVEIDVDGHIRLFNKRLNQDIWLIPKEWKRLKRYVKAATIKEENA